MTVEMVRDVPCPACAADSVGTARREYQEFTCHQCGRDVAMTTQAGVLTVSVKVAEGDIDRPLIGGV